MVPTLTPGRRSVPASHAASLAAAEGPSAILNGALGLFIASLPLAWLGLTEIDRFTFRPVHLSMVLLCAAALVSRTRPRVASLWSRQPAFAVFCGLYGLYLLLLTSSLLWANPADTRPHLLLKYAANFFLFMVLFLVLERLLERPEGVAKAVFVGGWAGTALFVGSATWLFATIGRNLPREYLTAILEGNTHALQFTFYRRLFILTRLESAGDAVTTSLRNTLVGAFVLIPILVWCFRRNLRSAWPSRLTGVALWSLTLLCSFLVLASVSRSNVLALALAVAIGVLGGLLRGRGRFLLSSFAMVLVGGILLVLLVAVYPEFLSGLTNALQDRFGTIGQGLRIPAYAGTLDSIETHWLLGFGVGAGDPIFGGHVHNLFLSSWYEGGLFTMLSAVAFYTWLVVLWLRSILLVASSDLPRAPQPLAEWILALPVLPLLRSQLAGQGGNFQTVEWACLAFFFILRSRIAPTGDPT